MLSRTLSAVRQEAQRRYTLEVMAKIPLDPKEETRPMSDVEGRVAEVLRHVRESRRPLVLTDNGKEAVVLLDFDSYQDLLEEIETLQDIQRGLVDFEEGRVTPHDEVRARLLARFS